METANRLECFPDNQVNSDLSLFSISSAEIVSQSIIAAATATVDQVSLHESNQEALFNETDSNMINRSYSIYNIDENAVLKCPHVLRHLNLGSFHYWIERIQQFQDENPELHVDLKAQVDCEIHRLVIACGLQGMNEDMFCQDSNNSRVLDRLLHLMEPIDQCDFLLKLERSVSFDATNISIDQFSWNGYYRAYWKYSIDFNCIMQLMVSQYNPAKVPSNQSINTLFLKLLPMKLGRHIHSLLNDKMIGYYTMPLIDMMKHVNLILKSYNDACNVLHSVVSFLQMQRRAVKTKSSISAKTSPKKSTVSSESSNTNIEVMEACLFADSLLNCKKSRICSCIYDAEKRARLVVGYLDREHARDSSNGSIDQPRG